MKKLLFSVILLVGITNHSGAITPEENSIIISQGNESLIHSEFPKDTVSFPFVQAKDTVAKKSFWNRLYHYFADANQDKTQTKKFDFSIIGGPHYSSDTKLGIGLVAAGLFRVDRNDLSIPPSNISLFGDVTTSGFYLLGLRGNTLFKGGKFRLDHTTYFFSMPSKFWGVGYRNGMDSASTTMNRKQMQIKVDFLYRFAPKWYAGVNVGFHYTKGSDIKNPSYIPEGESNEYINTGIGACVLYDSRDVITAPESGWYFKLDQRFFPEFLGNKNFFTSTEFILDCYYPLWEGSILAADLHSVLHEGDVPWTMLSLMGGSYRMRGYYEGRFRDKNLIEGQLELRQKIYKRIGAVVWVGAGNVFPSFKDLNMSHTLPNYGLGLRWEFKKRVNVRLDYGFGKGETGFIFNINEAF